MCKFSCPSRRLWSSEPNLAVSVSSNTCPRKTRKATQKHGAKGREGGREEGREAGLSLVACLCSHSNTAILVVHPDIINPSPFTFSRRRSGWFPACLLSFHFQSSSPSLFLGPFLLLSVFRPSFLVQARAPPGWCSTGPPPFLWRRPRRQPPSPRRPRGSLILERTSPSRHSVAHHARERVAGEERRRRRMATKRTRRLREKTSKFSGNIGVLAGLTTNTNYRQDMTHESSPADGKKR